MTLREQIIHDLRMRGWSRIDAETKAFEVEARTASGIAAATAVETTEIGSTEGKSPTGEAGDAQ